MVYQFTMNLESKLKNFRCPQVLRWNETNVKSPFYRKCYPIFKRHFWQLNIFWWEENGGKKRKCKGKAHVKKAWCKTFLFSSSDRETQRCNGQKSRLSKLISIVQKQQRKYNIRDHYYYHSYLVCLFFFWAELSIKIRLSTASVSEDEWRKF